MINFDVAIVQSLKNRYNINALIFHRSVERAESGGELFDILDSCPKKMPVVWNESSRRWESVEDITLSNKFDFENVIKRRKRK